MAPRANVDTGCMNIDMLQVLGQFHSLALFLLFGAHWFILRHG